MKYRVTITEEALAQAYQFLHYIAEDQRSPLTAQRWWDKALQKIATLETFPRRCPVAPENEWSENELRVLIVDRCLFIYGINDDSHKVEIVKFRHGSQLPKPID